MPSASLAPSLILFSLLTPPPPISTLFPYTTLFRSIEHRPRVHHRGHRERDARRDVGLDEARDDIDRRASRDRKSTRLNSSHLGISYAVFCLKKKNSRIGRTRPP